MPVSIGPTGALGGTSPKSAPAIDPMRPASGLTAPLPSG